MMQRRAIYYFVKHNIAFLSESMFIALTVGHVTKHFVVTVELVLLRIDTIPALLLPFCFFQPFYGGR